jgi:ubiquinone/menaquinone biosynthesis C-methylase UbiE
MERTDDRERVRRGYDALADTYAARQSADERTVRILGDVFESLAAADRVLDAGCGHGEPVLRRADAVATAVGLDLSRRQLQIAAETVPTAPLVHGDMTSLPFRDSLFDAVVAHRSVIHVPLSDHRAVFEEFARVLGPGGKLLLSEAPEERERTTDDWLDSGAEMRWEMAGADATREGLRAVGFSVFEEWPAPDPVADEPPRPPFFAARLDE